MLLTQGSQYSQVAIEGYIEIFQTSLKSYQKRFTAYPALLDLINS